LDTDSYSAAEPQPNNHLNSKKAIDMFFGNSKKNNRNGDTTGVLLDVSLSLLDC
jgi:hypothetical protein